MTKQSPARRVALILPLLMLLPVSACGGPTVQGIQTFPRVADIETVTTPKPKPPFTIADDPQVEAQYNADVEAHDNSLYDAGVRICNWAVERGLKLPFKCQRN